MSNEAINLTRRADIRPSGRKFVMMALADYADEAWSCFPHVSTIAAYTGQGDKTVRDHLDALERDGLIKRERSRREDGTLGGYRYFIQRQKLPVADFASGEKPPKPPAKIAAPYTPDLSPSDNNNAREGVSAISDAWSPDAQSCELGRELGLIPQEVADVVEEFIEYWRAEARTKRGRKSERGWQLTYRTRLRTLAKQWGRRPPSPGHGSGQHASGGGFTAAALELVAEARQRAQVSS